LPKRLELIPEVALNAPLDLRGIALLTKRQAAGAAYSNGRFQHQPSLMESLQFTPDDLAANRAGRLSAAQQAQLRSRVLALLPLRLLMASLPLTYPIFRVSP
jgi:hypothetical protein